MYCCISGQEPIDPVVSVKSGHLFERRLIEEYIRQQGKCPVTDQPLTIDDLLPVKSHSTPTPRPASATSIPGMLHLFQNEWDSLMLETFTLKKHLDTVRQELSHSLYQHDAATRVVARLVQERDAARKALTEAGHGESGVQKMEEDEGLSPQVLGELKATAEELSSMRKERKIPSTLVSVGDLKNFQAKQSVPVSAPVQCLAVHPRDDTHIAVGSADGQISVLSTASSAVVARFSVDKLPITDLCFHAPTGSILSASVSGKGHLWTHSGDEYRVAATFEGQEGPLSAITLHPSTNYAVTTSEDGTWAMFDVPAATRLVKTQPVETGFTCGAFHPDGLLLGTGGQDNIINIWDVKTQNNLAAFRNHTAPVTCLSFSENGYYLASGSEDGTVRVWDLRKLAQVANPIQLGGKVESVSFDHSGSYLAVGSTDLRVFQNKTWAELLVLESFGGPVKGVGFGRDAHFIVGGSMDKTVKLFTA